MYVVVTPSESPSMNPTSPFYSVTPCLVIKFKILNLSHQTGILHAWSTKSRRNKQLIAYFTCKLRDESNEPN